LVRRLWSLLWVWLACSLAAPVSAVDGGVQYGHATPGRAIQLPADEGSHPEFRTEWWYVTGWLDDDSGESRGFQVTFFRSRPGTAEDNPSAFAPKQLLFAHAAVSDPRRGRLLRDEKAAREGFGLAAARSGQLDVFIDDWALRREPGAAAIYSARVASRDFQLDLRLRAVQPALLQGEGGFSQKQPDARFASYYYSLPQLQVTGSLVLGQRVLRVRGTAWLDHEWSSAIMDERSRGWDWVGLNLNDGGALMAFQVRDLQGVRRWAAGTVRSAPSATEDGFESVRLRPVPLRPEEIEWQPLRRWRSPRTGVEYPIGWRVRAGSRVFILRPLLDDQENDARGSTGTLYWEGAVSAEDERGEPLGRGYLELTGYGAPVRF
jgi:predicted secreted hydrolase